jgi:hypothetical protein
MRHAPTSYELKATRIGPMAAAANRPLVMTTRVGLPVGKVYMFDDVWHDVLVNFVGVSREAIRPLEMCCLDVASGSKVAYGMLPRVKRDDGSHINLSEREMRQLVVAVLLNQGYRPDGTLLTVEHGTAAIRPGSDFAVALDAITGGAVRVVRGGIQSVFKGQWEAARSLGLSSGQLMRLVILPQALRVIIPPLTSQYLNLTKNSSLAVAITAQDSPGRLNAFEADVTQNPVFLASSETVNQGVWGMGSSTSGAWISSLITSTSEASAISARDRSVNTTRIGRPPSPFTKLDTC